jgi:hypothetical protein
MNEKKEPSLGEKPIAVKRHPLRFLARIWWNCWCATVSDEFYLKELAAFEASLQGELPTGRDVSDLILVACNDAYFAKYAHALINSAAAVDQHFAVHIHLLDPSQKTLEEIQLLQCRHSTVRLSFTIDQGEIANTLQYRNIYYTAARFLLVPSLLERGVTRVLVIDIDTIMKNSPWPILDQGVKSDNGAFIFRSRQWKPWKKILASAVYYRSTERSLKMSKRIAKSILATIHHKPKYHIDQVIPHYIMQIGLHRLRSTYSQMPHDIMSYRYAPSAAFWTTKGPEKEAEQFTQAKAQFEN